MNITILRASFDRIVERHPDVTRVFYDILFERYPQVRALFGRNTRAAQEKMLTQALALVIEHVEDASWLEDTLSALGAKHAGYGVTDEMYDWVGECLLAALAQAEGEDWTRDVEEAWLAAYGAIAGTMRAAGAREAARAVRLVSVSP